MVSAIKVYDPMNIYHQAMKKIESSGIRPTKQRRVLAKILFEKGNRHLSADELFHDVKKEDRKISMATVYNTLNIPNINVVVFCSLFGILILF